MSAQHENAPAREGTDALAELTAKLARKNEEIRIIQQISAEVLATLELDEILDVSLKTMAAALEFNHCMILLASPSGEVLQLAASFAFYRSVILDEAGITIQDWSTSHDLVSLEDIHPPEFSPGYGVRLKSSYALSRR